MQHRAIYIADDIHCEQDGPYASAEAAVAELRRRAAIAWDAAPNLAPCMSWRTCGRAYHVLEFDVQHQPWRLLRKAGVLNMSAKGVEWSEQFERDWAASGGSSGPAHH